MPAPAAAAAIEAPAPDPERSDSEPREPVSRVERRVDPFPEDEAVFFVFAAVAFVFF